MHGCTRMQPRALADADVLADITADAKHARIADHGIFANVGMCSEIHGLTELRTFFNNGTRVAKRPFRTWRLQRRKKRCERSARVFNHQQRLEWLRSRR